MKKVLSIIALIAVTLTASAQEIETLTYHKTEGDPMTNTSSGEMWIGTHVGISLPDNGFNKIMFKMKDHIFVKNYSTKIGYYTANDSLIGMGTIVTAPISGDGQIMSFSVAFSNDSLPHSEYSEKQFVMPKSWRVRVRDMITWLKETDGYLRFVTRTYGEHIYDVRFRLKKEE
jgi:hypothetical protein